MERDELPPSLRSLLDRADFMDQEKWEWLHRSGKAADLPPLSEEEYVEASGDEQWPLSDEDPDGVHRLLWTFARELREAMEKPKLKRDRTYKAIGFTGTRRGMTRPQVEQVRSILAQYGARNGFEFHHGDCVGADAQAHQLVSELPQCSVVLHPPTEDNARAFCSASVKRNPLPYLDRNHAIVKESGLMIAVPSQKEEIVRSGTWATIRHARKAKKPILIVFPDGTVGRRNIERPENVSSNPNAVKKH